MNEKQKQLRKSKRLSRFFFQDKNISLASEVRKVSALSGLGLFCALFLSVFFESVSLFEITYSPFESISSAMSPDDLEILTPHPSGQSFLARFYQESASKVVYVTGINVEPTEKSTQEFFRPSENTPEEQTVGTGFILHEDGYVITNAHSVNRTLVPEIELRDGRRFPAEIMAVAPKQDLALLKIKVPERLSAVSVEPNPEVSVGDSMITIGSPHALKYTLSYGIVSAMDRSSVVTDIPGLVLRGLLQTDAPINPGNSGGPWFNLYGKVMGITVAKRGDSDNIAFGISLETIHYEFPLMLHRASRKQWDLPFRVTGNRYAKTFRARMVDIEPSFSKQHNLQEGDTILALNGEPVVNAIEFYLKLLSRKTGESLTLTLLRSDALAAYEQEQSQFFASVNSSGRLPVRSVSHSQEGSDSSIDDPRQWNPNPPNSRQIAMTLSPRTVTNPSIIIQARLRMKVRPLTESEITEFNLRVRSGLVIEDLDEGIFKGLQYTPRRGDILARINLERPDSPEHLAEILENISADTLIDMVILRREVADQKATFTRIDINNWKAH